MFVLQSHGKTILKNTTCMAATSNRLGPELKHCLYCPTDRPTQRRKATHRPSTMALIKSYDNVVSKCYCAVFCCATKAVATLARLDSLQMIQFGWG